MEKDKITTEIKKAQEQVKPSTSLVGEMVLNALENQYISGYPKPDFSYSEAYKKLEKAASECESSIKLQQIIKKKLKIQRTGTISKEEQARIFNAIRSRSGALWGHSRDVSGMYKTGNHMGGAFTVEWS